MIACSRFLVVLLCQLLVAAALRTDGEEDPLRLKVVGGRLASPGEYGYVALIDTGKGGYCSGVLYASDYLLSAAHCFIGSTGDGTYNVTQVKVTVGINDFSARTTNDTYDVADIWLHQGYKGLLLGMDLATIHLARKTGPQVPKVKMITSDLARLVVPGKTPAKVVGWGETYPRIYGETGDLSPNKGANVTNEQTRLKQKQSGVQREGPRQPQLQEASMQILSNEECEKRIRPSGNQLAKGEQSRPLYIKKHMVCAEDKGTSVCAGDGGAPLIAQIDGEWYLYGLASWSLNCARRDHPSVFTRISSHLPWVNGGNGTILDRRALRGSFTSL